MTLLKDVFIVSGAGVGGGSLVYANTLDEPLQPYDDDPEWAHISDWRDEYAPYYDQAARMSAWSRTPPSPTSTACCSRSPSASGSPRPGTPPRSACGSASPT